MENTKDVIQKVVANIELINIHKDNITQAIRFIRHHSGKWDDSLKGAQTLQDILTQQELEEWRILMMWGLVVDTATRDRLKVAAMERFLSREQDVSYYISDSPRLGRYIFIFR